MCGIVRCVTLRPILASVATRRTKNVDTLPLAHTRFTHQRSSYLLCNTTLWQNERFETHWSQSSLCPISQYFQKRVPQYLSTTPNKHQMWPRKLDLRWDTYMQRNSTQHHWEIEMSKDRGTNEADWDGPRILSTRWTGELWTLHSIQSLRCTKSG